MLEPYLEDLEKRIDTSVEQQLRDEWLAFLEGRFEEEVFEPRRDRSAPAGIKWPEVSVNEAQEDPEKMVIQQMKLCSDILAAGTGAAMSVRANYGTGIMPSLFGAELFYMDEEYNTLPATRPMKGGWDRLAALVDHGVPDLESGFGRRVLETSAFFRDLFKDYPKIQQWVKIAQPDLQGPMDVCELLWGSDLFVDLLMNPEHVKELLEVITDTYSAFMRRWLAAVEPDNCVGVYFGMLYRGKIMLREDSAMNLSPDMFQEFIVPYDQRLMDEFDGGAIHFCGRGEHFIPHAVKIRGVDVLNLTQPEYNDMEKVFQATVDQGMKLVGLPKVAVEEAQKRGRPLRGLVNTSESLG